MYTNVLADNCLLFPSCWLVHVRWSQSLYGICLSVCASYQLVGWIDTIIEVYFVDVFSANVLLDLSFRAKVGDFGLARPLHDISDTRTSRVVGTSGYIPPEYYRGTITTKMDSFAFGVVRKWKPVFLVVLSQWIRDTPTEEEMRFPQSTSNILTQYTHVGVI